MYKVMNPILKGFNPDPSICRVGDDYYIATSTFQWYPGVQIHHSTDLKNWRLLTRPLRRDSQLNMLGEFPSCGIWAPCLSYDNGTFYLVYTDVKDNGAPHNYLVTTRDIEGDWSEPIYMNSRGFDASLFHDENGKKWFLSMTYDHAWWHSGLSFRYSRTKAAKNLVRIRQQAKERSIDPYLFKGILLQEYDEASQSLVGEVKNIFKGSELGITEGPHLYKRGEYYYLLTAEGGTGFQHAVTLARAKNIEGPYELHPENPIMTSWNKGSFLKRAGHGDLVDTVDGDTYLVHLCSRPINGDKLRKARSILGRETGIQRMEWRDDGWLWHTGPDNSPLQVVQLPELPEVIWPEPASRDDFDGERLGIDFQWLRGDYFDEIASLTVRPGFLRLYGKEIPQSYFKQALIARRLQSFKATIRTAMEFDPEEPNQHAGLIVTYNEDMFYYLYKGRDAGGGTYLAVMSNINSKFNLYKAAEVAIPKGRIYLRADVHYRKLRFSYSKDHKAWEQIGKIFDMSKLSDEKAKGGFTGTFVGLCCQDPLTMKHHADFDYFDYKEIE